MAHNDSLKLKRLQTERFTLQQEISTLQAQQANIRRDLERLLKEYSAVKRQIVAFEEQSKTITVSEHAILRYFERVLGYDLEVIVAAILPETAKQGILQLGTGTYPIVSAGKRYRVCIDGSTLTTVLADES